MIGLALAGCADAAADGAGEPAVFERMRVAPGAGWQRLRAVERVATEAAATIPAAATVIEAWGDPGAGCYAIGVDSRGTRAEGVAASFDRFVTALAPFGVDSAALPRPSGEVVDTQIPITIGELTGDVRIRLYRDAKGIPQAMALACASNPREPVRCKIQCAGLFAQMAPPELP